MTQTAEELVNASALDSQLETGTPIDGQPDNQVADGVTEPIAAPDTPPEYEDPQYKGKSLGDIIHMHKEAVKKLTERQQKAEDVVQAPVQQEPVVNPIEASIAKTTRAIAENLLKNYEVETIDDEGYRTKTKLFNDDFSNYNQYDPEHQKAWNKCLHDAEISVLPQATLARETFAYSEQIRLQQTAPTEVKRRAEAVLQRTNLAGSLTVDQMLKDLPAQAFVNIANTSEEETSMALETLAYAQLGRQMIAGAVRVPSQNPNVTTRDTVAGTTAPSDPGMAAAIRETKEEYSRYNLPEKDIIEIAKSKLEAKRGGK